ncbi:MAG TPA: acylphosphatase [bacterium]|nr:acylphosphatase [bacterium]
MAERVHILVTGRVQGVGYRHFTLQQARRLGITGWVRNLPGGEVEVLASLPPGTRERFLAALRRGPPMAEVDGVAVTPAAPQQEPPPAIFRVVH